VVLVVGDVVAPVRVSLGDRQVGHVVIRGGAVPVFLAVGSVDDVARAELDRVLAADLDKAPAFGDMQGLAPVVAVPGRARAGGEADRGHVEL
jgi:hypothetical protein